MSYFTLSVFLLSQSCHHKCSVSVSDRRGNATLFKSENQHPLKRLHPQCRKIEIRRFVFDLVLVLALLL